MMAREGPIKYVNFMTPGAGFLILGHDRISGIVKMHYFFLNILLNSCTYIKKPEYIVMMSY